MDLGANAWDGWIGALLSALIGSAATVSIGWFVVRRTIRHERDEAIEQHRVEAWAELAAAQLALGPTIDDGPLAVRRAQMDLVLAAQRWAVYMASDREFARVVFATLSQLNLSAYSEAIDEDGSFERWRAPGSRPRLLGDALLRHGRIWATERSRRAEAESALHDTLGREVDLGADDW